MRDKQELLKYVSEFLDVAPQDLSWSDLCNNPTEGFSHAINDTQVSNAGQGYWVVDKNRT